MRLSEQNSKAASLRNAKDALASFRELNVPEGNLASMRQAREQATSAFQAVPPVSGAGHSGSAQCANRLCKGEATALRAVAVASLGVDAFGALQAANQSLKTFKDHGAVRFWTRQG